MWVYFTFIWGNYSISDTLAHLGEFIGSLMFTLDFLVLKMFPLFSLFAVLLIKAERCGVLLDVCLHLWCWNNLASSRRLLPQWRVVSISSIVWSIIERVWLEVLLFSSFLLEMLRFNRNLSSLRYIRIHSLIYIHILILLSQVSHMVISIQILILSHFSFSLLSIIWLPTSTSIASIVTQISVSISVALESRRHRITYTSWSWWWTCRLVPVIKIICLNHRWFITLFEVFDIVGLSLGLFFMLLSWYMWNGCRFLVGILWLVVGKWSWRLRVTFSQMSFKSELSNEIVSIFALPMVDCVLVHFGKFKILLFVEVITNGEYSGMVACYFDIIWNFSLDIFWKLIIFFHLYTILAHVFHISFHVGEFHLLPNNVVVFFLGHFHELILNI